MAGCSETVTSGGLALGSGLVGRLPSAPRAVGCEAASGTLERSRRNAAAATSAARDASATITRLRERPAIDCDLPQSVWVCLSPLVPGAALSSGPISVSASPGGTLMLRMVVEAGAWGAKDERRIPEMRETEGSDALEACGASA